MTPGSGSLWLCGEHFCCMFLVWSVIMFRTKSCHSITPGEADLWTSTDPYDITNANNSLVRNVWCVFLLLAQPQECSTRGPVCWWGSGFCWSDLSFVEDLDFVQELADMDPSGMMAIGIFSHLKSYKFPSNAGDTPSTHTYVKQRTLQLWCQAFKEASDIISFLGSWGNTLAHKYGCS
jgi:hypothetical protein